MQLSGKSIIVTGGNRGIGLEITRQLLYRGNNIVATTRQPKEASELDQLRALHSNRLTVTELDVSNPQSIQSWAAELKNIHKHFDLVINNAGVIRRTGIEDVTPSDMLDCFTTNTIGPLLVVQQLKKQGLIGHPGTVIAQVSSKMGSIGGYPKGGNYAYKASKSALNVVTKSLSIDLAGEGITCTMLHPGYVKTGMTGGAGDIGVEESAAGMLAVLESSLPLNGRWYDYTGRELPW